MEVINANLKKWTTAKQQALQYQGLASTSPQALHNNLSDIEMGAINQKSGNEGASLHFFLEGQHSLNDT